MHALMSGLLQLKSCMLWSSAGRYAALARLVLHASMSAQACVLQLDLVHMDTP